MTFHAVLLNNESKRNCSSTSSETPAICFLSNAATYQWIIWFTSDWWPIMLINRLVLLLLRPTHALFLCSSFICLTGGSSNASHSCFLCLLLWKAMDCDSSDHPFQPWSYFFLHCTFWPKLLLFQRFCLFSLSLLTALEHDKLLAFLLSWSEG